MMLKGESWPMVRPDDNGIRPGGGPDKCFYCHAKIGDLHDETCVVVESLVLYSVWANGKRVGTYKNYEPWHWDADRMEFMRNESSWCADNALQEIEWEDADARERVAIVSDEKG